MHPFILRRIVALCTAVVAIAPGIGAQVAPRGEWIANPSSAFPSFGVTFGGAGINAPANATVLAPPGAMNDGPLLLLGASSRFDNAAVTNDGNGTFTARAGVDACTPLANAACPTPGYATWNFNFFIGGPNVTAYQYALFWDLQPAAGTTESNLSTFGQTSLKANSQNSWNLGMGFLDLNGPLMPNFDPMAVGEYTFVLAAYDLFTISTLPSAAVDYVAIRVNTVASVVPEPSTYALMAAGLTALGLVARRRRHRGTPASATRPRS